MKTTTKITKNLFDLTQSQIDSSISMYGKVIKCLIAPYHNIQNIPLESNDEVYVYPERDLSIQQRKEMVGVMANSNKKEICFVTSDLFLILDMIDCCCRILTPDGKIEELYEKTFSANPHTIIYKILQNDVYEKLYKDGVKDYRNKINDIIKVIVDVKTMTKSEYDKNMAVIELIGEDLIRNKMKSMMRNVTIIREPFKKEDFDGVVTFTSEETEFLKSRSWYKENLTIKVCLEKCRASSKDSEEILNLLNQLIEIQNKVSKPKEECEKNIDDKEKNEKELKMRHKIEYWLSEQDENQKIQSVLK